MKNKKVLIWAIIGVVAVALVALAVTLVITNSNKEKEKETPKKEEPKQQEKKKKETNEVEIDEVDEISEEEIIAIYGFSKQDAEDLIRKAFTTNEYEFSTKITRAGFYRVTVKDTVNNDILTFRVDPATQEAIQE